MTDNERFADLWASFKEHIVKARTERPKVIATDGELPFGEGLGGHVSVRQGDIDGATIAVDRGGWGGAIHCQSQDLMEIAAHCVIAAEEIEEAKRERNAAA